MNITRYRFGSVIVKQGPVFPEGNVDAPAGSIFVQDSGVTYYKQSGAGVTGWVRFGNTRTVNTVVGSFVTVGTTPLTVLNYTMAAKTLIRAGDGIRFKERGAWAANANNKSVIISFNGSPIVSLGPATVNGGSWFCDVFLSRTSVAQLDGWATIFTRNGVGADLTLSVPLSVVGLDLDNVDYPITLVLTGVNNGDITAGPTNVILQPNQDAS